MTRTLKADFHHFYNTHFERVYRFVYFRVRMNKEVAEDITSEIFLKALKHFASYDPKQSHTAWIMTIARNTVINHYRDQKQIVDIDELAFALPGADGRDEATAADDARQLCEAMSLLRPKEREILELKYIEGYRYKEIGELLGKSAGAARIEAHRAMRNLKKILEKTYGVCARTTEEAA